MRALIIEDDRYITEALMAALENISLIVDTASDGESGAFRAITEDYDIILLDTMLPKKNGLEVCNAIRLAGKTTPILSISAKSDATTKVALLNTGVDDYISKPFVLDEVIARIHALLRRPKQIVETTLSIDTLEINTRTRSVRRNGKPIHLTRKEFDLLEYLLRHSGSVLSRSTLLEHVWDSEVNLFSNTVEAHIRTLRLKIERRNRPRLIHTVPGCGYKIALAA